MELETNTPDEATPAAEETTPATPAAEEAAN